MNRFLPVFCLSIWALSLVLARIQLIEATKTADPLSADIFIEENPEFITDDNGGDSNSDDDNDNGDESNSEDDDDDEIVVGKSKDAKNIVSITLKKTKKRTNKAIEVIKKNRSRITIALVVFAFRNEILRGMKKMLTKRNLTMTDILKLILFVDSMRRIQTGGLSSTTNSNFFDIVKKFGQINPILSAIIDKVICHNPAYLPPIDQHFTFERLNEYYVKDGMALKKAIENKHEGMRWPASSSGSSISSRPSSTKKATGIIKKSISYETVVILDWTKLDTHISSMEELRQQISFLLSQYRTLGMQQGGENVDKNATNNDESIPIPAALEVVVHLESPGGSVSEYGLLGQHLLRLKKEPGVTLTICVDKVAASGGYLLCCTASPGKLFAAPFALVGSIGVIATQLNVNKILNDWGIQSLVFRGGKDKAPIGLIGEVTKEGKRTTQIMIDDTHRAFKEHVVNSRPVLKNNIDIIANGNVWLGVDAVELNLIDAIKTSDEYTEGKIRDGAQVFKMIKTVRSGFLFGPTIGSNLNFASGGFKINPPSSSSLEGSLEDDVQNLIQKRRIITMARLPANVKTIFSKTLQYFN